jgi:hypothetical protein
MPPDTSSSKGKRIQPYPSKTCSKTGCDEKSLRRRTLCRKCAFKQAKGLISDLIADDATKEVERLLSLSAAIAIDVRHDSLTEEKKKYYAEIYKRIPDLIVNGDRSQSSMWELFWGKKKPRTDSKEKMYDKCVV